MKGEFTVNKLITPHGIANYRVDGRVNGKRIRFFCRTKEEALEKAELKNAELENHGHRHSHIADSLRIDAIRAAEILAPYGNISLVMAAQDWAARHDVRATSLPVGEACDRFIADCERKLGTEEIGSRHYSALVKTMRKFKAQFGSELMCDVQPAAIKAWINGLRHFETGKPLALGSKKHHRTSLHNLFAQAEEWGWVKTNPVAKVGILSNRRDRMKEPGILSVQEAAKMLEVAEERALPVIAIGLFAGLRQAEIHKLRWENIHWIDREIDCSAKITKTASRRLVKMSDNLLEWLAPYRNARGPIFEGCEGRMIRAVTDTGRAAGIAKWPQNALRHSFGSYYLAMSGNAPETALAMGHHNGETKTLMAHYNKRSNKEQAAAYWAIRPLIAPEKILAIA